MSYLFSIPPTLAKKWVRLPASAAQVIVYGWSLLAAGPVVGQIDHNMETTGLALNLHSGYEDNMYFQPEELPDYVIGSSIFQLEPEAWMRFNTSQWDTLLFARHESGFYHYNEHDNYNDNELMARVNYAPSLRHRFGFEAHYWDAHERRGQGLTQGQRAFLIDSPIEFDLYSVRANYALGARGATGNFTLGLNHEDKRYSNHELFTGDRNYRRAAVDTSFHYRISNSTRFVVQALARSTDYYAIDNVSVTNRQLDSQTYQALAGVEWRLTGQTQGQIKVGYLGKTFDAPGRDEFEGISWDASVTWSIRSYSELYVSAVREDKEPNTAENLIDASQFEIAWEHQWLQRLQSRLSLTYEKEDYVGSLDNREDRKLYAQARMDYAMRRWLRFGASVAHGSNDSTRSDLEYDRSIFMLDVMVKWQK